MASVTAATDGSAAGSLQEGDAQEAAKQQLFEECRALARAMPPIGKDGSSAFFLGSQFSLVDIALAPFWQRMLWVGSYYRGLEFPTDEPEFKRLAMWWEAVRQRPSVAATLVCRQRLVSSYSQYSQNVATSDLAKSMWSSLSDLKDEAAGTEWPMAPALVLGAWLAACGAGVFFYFRHLRNAW